MVIRRLIAVAAIAVTLLIAATVLAFSAYRSFIASPLAMPATGEVWTLEPGTSYRSMVRELESRGWARWGWRWRVLGMLDDRPSRLQAGEYRLDAGMTPVALLERLASGDVVLYDFTLIEGWTVRQARSALAEAPGIKVTLGGVPDDELAEIFAIEAPSAEGWFLPETYRYARGTTDAELLLQAHQAMATALAEVWSARDPALPYRSPYDVLIMASIIERETGAPDERTRIAGVFVRRLQVGMRLQTDPTVIYGLGERFDGNLRRRDLRADTPWNTYTRHGLPVTPIALPGRASLDAAILPADEDALYFVSRGDGTHVFSPTLEAHEAAVDKYQRKRR